MCLTKVLLSVQWEGHIAKINFGYLDTLKDKPDGKLILVLQYTPTPAGEGKTTTSVGLNDGLK